MRPIICAQSRLLCVCLGLGLFVGVRCAVVGSGQNTSETRNCTSTSNRLDSCGVKSAWTAESSYMDPVYSLQQWNTTENSTFLLALSYPVTTTSLISTPTLSSISEMDHPETLTLSWQQACIVALFLLLILITVIGNTLVILSVLTTRRLRTITNCFVMNLAIADWLVGTCVMPPAVVLYIVGSWQFGWILCDIWISLDVLLCTASILSLCAISIDRYLAVIQPLTYSKKRRSKRLALLMILVVWLVAVAITCPPFFGWYEQGRKSAKEVECRYNQNKGYVVFSAMGSFFIPMTVMLYVYLNIGCVLTSRRHRMTLTEASEKSPDVEFEKFPSEVDNLHSTPEQSSYKHFETDISSRHTLYELVEISRSSSTIRCSTITCKYAENKGNRPIQAIRFSQSHTSISESNVSASKLKVQHQNQQQQQQQQQNLGNHESQHQQQQQQINPAGKYHRIPMRISTLKRDTKTAKTLTMVMGGFIACWLPFFIYYLLIPFIPKEAVSEGLMSFLTWLGWINCAINPFIYAFYNADFRAAFWRLTFRKVCKKQNHLLVFNN